MRLLSMFLLSALLQTGCGLQTSVSPVDSRVDAGGADTRFGRDSGAQNEAGLDSGLIRDAGADAAAQDVRPVEPDAEPPCPTPDADEVCNGEDDNCNGLVDEDEACVPCITDSFRGKTYLFCPDTRDWDAARVACAEKGYGDLVVIDSEEVDTYIREGAFAIEIRDWWIGLHDPTNGTYEWVDGEVIYQDGSPVEGTYNHWRGDRPEDMPAEACVEYDESGAWADNDCAEEQPYVCEQSSR